MDQRSRTSTRTAPTTRQARQALTALAADSDPDLDEALRRIRNPRKTASYTDLARAEHDRHCTRCRTLTEDAAARAAVYGESIRRRDRLTLGLRVNRTAVAA
ncbi:hypothetical protein E6R18_25200 [Streptomyces sp. A1277]|uniref:hypothetical protein n=1 Tax=Streptomyces sp. A1277 TaxID=2563103 RepID=UPI0010A25960|nr:hypothetical protein [Streptomyces sp. A1277]THA29209.1 hypothetical protein E6R18_25200 [Streptomyces sp. A1277]